MSCQLNEFLATFGISILAKNLIDLGAFVEILTVIDYSLNSELARETP